MAQRRFPDTESMIRALRPSYPVYCMRPDVIQESARWFTENFPGRVLYAVKCNPNREVLRHLYKGGVRYFDTASLPEIALVNELLPESESYFMHTVKSRAAIRNAYHVYGVRHFSVDHPDELAKVLAETRDRDISVLVRMATPPAGAALDLSTKFGARPAEAVELLKEVDKAGCTPGLCFHVGSQCLTPNAYRLALELVASVIDSASTKIAYLDIGGGFPAAYEGAELPPMEDFFHEIREGLDWLKLPEDCIVMSEPGRALVAEGCSLVVQIHLRKDDSIYINDGIFGSLNETVTAHTRPPVRLVRLDGEPSPDTFDFTVNGPTCDSTDVLPFPMRLPADAREGDWMEIGCLGAYSNATATNFNGFYPETFVEVEERFRRL